VTWRGVLFTGALVAVALVAVGVVIDSASIHALGLRRAQAAEQWPSPFQQEVAVVYQDSAGESTLKGGDAPLWYFAGGAILALTLAALPLLRERDSHRRA
jgi:uncharacterized membrane protein YdcZ (DUF606 family)